MTITIIAVAVIAVIAIAAIVLMGNGGNDKPSEGITIIDGSGQEITIQEPIESCTVVNTNLPKAMKVLSLQDNVENIIFYKSSDYQEYYDMEFTRIDENAPLASGLNNAEYFITHNVKYIIEPVSSNKLTKAAEDACKNAGITVIKLDCYGDTMIEDMEKLVKLFGSTKKVQNAFVDYKSTREKVIEAVLGKTDIKESDRFLFYFAGLTAFYTQEAELSKMMGTIWGHNAIADVLSSPSGVTVKANVAGIKEDLTELNGVKPIELLIIRATGGDQADDLEGKWIGKPIADYDLAYLKGKNSAVYCIESDLLSGPIDYIAYVALAEIAGIDTGFSVYDLVHSYLDKYGFKLGTETYIWHYEFDDDGTLMQVVKADIE